MTTNAKKSRRADDDDRDSYSISNAILEESMKLCSELRSYVYFAFSLKSIRLVVFDTFPRAMHSIWSSFHVIVGALICTSAAISLAFAFDVSAMFFTMPLCFLAVGGRLMTPTEIDDERLRRKAAEAYYKAKATFERGRRRRNKMMKKKRRIVNANNYKEDETESSSDDEHVLGKEEYETRERARLEHEARAAWREMREKQKEKNDPQFRPLPECGLWPHGPVFIRSSAREPSQRCVNNSWSRLKKKKDTKEEDEKEENEEEGEEEYAEWNELTDTCPVNTETALEFETDIFKGKVVCRFLGMEGETPEQFYIERGQICNNIAFQVVVQGEFKERIRMDQVVTGGEFKRPFENIPPRTIVYTGQELFKVITPGLACDVTANEPYYLALLGGLVSQMSVDTKETVPNILDFMIPEHCDIVEGNDGFFQGVKHLNMQARGSRRVKELANPATAKKYYYEPGLIYTFDNMQSYLHLDTYSFDVGKVLTLKLERHLNGQPIQFFAKTGDGRYAFCFEMWHEKLLPHAPECSEEDYVRFALEGKIRPV
ncbi:unnamed protein product [Bathycoccus prasinos]